MSKRKKFLPVAAREGDGALLPIVKKVRKKHLQPGEEQNTDTVETECKTVTEGQGTEDITMKPTEEEELVNRSHDKDHTEQRTDLIAQEVEEKGCRANGSQDGEHFLLPLSQNSAGKYVPVFAKPKKRLSRSNSVRHVMENVDRESLNNSKVEGDDGSQNMDLEGSGSCLPAVKHQVQESSQPPEQIACNTTTSQLTAKEQQETETDEDCVKQGSDGDVSLSGIQVGTEHVGREIEELTCHPDQKNSDITEIKNKSNKLDSIQFEMDVLCSALIPIAHSTADERPLTPSEHKTQNSSTHFSEEELDCELLSHTLYQEKTDDVSITHEELTICQGVKKECTIAINKDVDRNVESSVLVPETLRNSSCREKTHNVLEICEELTLREVNKCELAVQMNLTTDLLAQSDLKYATCSQPTDLLCSNTLHQLFDTNAENQVENTTFNSQFDIMDRHKNVNEELQEPSSYEHEAKLSTATRNGAMQSFDGSQKGFDSDWSDMNVPCSSGTEVTGNKILHKDSDDHHVKLQQQPRQCFPEVKTMEIEHETLPGHQGEMGIASNLETQKIIQNFCKSFNGHGINIEGCNSANCSNAGEESKQLIQEVLNNRHSDSPLSTDYADQKCNSAAQSQAGLGEQYIGPRQLEYLETPLPNTMLNCSQADLLSTKKTVDVSKSIVAFKVHTGNSCNTEPHLGLEKGITGSQELEVTEKALPDTSLNPSQTTVHPTKNEEVILATEVNGHQMLFDSNCNGKVTKDNKEQLDSKMSLVSTNELKSNILSSLDNVDFQIESNVSNITEEKNKVALGRREIQHKVSIKKTNEDVTATLLLPGSGIDDCADRRQQEDKGKKKIQGGGSISTDMECRGVSINGNQESGIEEQAIQSLMGHNAEKESLDETVTFDETVFPVEEMDMELGYDLAAADVNTLPKTGPNLAAIPIVFPQYQSPEDFTKRHGDLSMTFPPSRVEMADSSPNGGDVNTETGHDNKVKECHGINSINEGKGSSLSVVDVGSSSKEQKSNHTQHVSASQSVNQRDKSEQKPSPNTKRKASFEPTHDKVQPGDKDYELQLIKPTLENKDVTEVSLLAAPQEDNANFASELEDLHLSEADWQVFSASAEEEEDATHVVCGLINELSKINRVIMITHRELESMKRHKHRKVRPVGRHPSISKGATNVTYSVKRKDL
ncbi:uncharacterized protein [Heptranchias perlo]|uniref:uncharacterized protein n=1 Tax=Heptranchias perlo TaxID=212740 RepID=UPI00355A17BF